MRAAIVTLMAGCLLVSIMLPASAEARVSTEEVVEVGFDLVILRPAGALSVLVGAAFFVPSMVMTLPNGKAGVDQAREIFIDGPWESTFRRSLGDW
jgi:hypothetical protein